MRFIKTKILLFILASCTLQIKQIDAQESGSLFLLPSVSQSSSLNPALQNKTKKLVVGIPLLSGSNFSWNTNFPLNAFFTGYWGYSFHNFYNNLDKFGKGQASSKIYMFYSSLNYKEFTFSVSLSEKAFATANFDREIVRLIRDGVQPYFGKNDNFGSGSFNFNHYRELAFGISQRYWDNLDIGIRPKILFGRTYFDAQNINFSITTDTENQTLLLKPEGSFTLSGPVVSGYDSIFDYTTFSADIYPGDYFFNFHNISFAIDLGIIFRPNRYSEVGASLLDFGFTGYKHNSYDVNFKEPIIYTESTLYQSHTPGIGNYIESRKAINIFMDSVSYVIKVTDEYEKTYKLIPIKLNFYGKYSFSPLLTAGINNQFSYYGKQSVNFFSGFLNLTPGSKAELGGSLSLYNLSDILIGLGASYTGEHFQYYISSNNILGIIQPLKSKHLNLSFGINLLFNTVRK